MMKSDEKYQVPAWMRPLLPLLCNTGGNDPEELLNDTETTASANVVRYVLIVAVRSQVDLLQLLYRKGLLRTEIPGGFSPEEAQALLDNLVRSHISKALSGERMAARDRNADLAWIGQQLVDAAWFVRATLEAHGMSVGNESPPAPPETMPDIQTRELVMLIKRLASSLKAVKPDSCVVRRTGCATENLWISQIFSGEPGMYILRRDMPIMIVSFQGWSGDHAVCSLLSPE